VRGMSTAQSIRRDFHRLGLFLAAITLLDVGGLGALMAFSPGGSTDSGGVSLAGWALASAIAVYTIVRAIGWVVAGFVGHDS